jgi:hypothetical protein
MLPAYIILALAVISMEALLLLARAKLTYRIRQKTLDIYALGILLKRIQLGSIRKVNKDKLERTENWSNRFNLHRRRLTIYFKDRKKKPVTITPEQRYVFRSKLEQAIETLESESALPKSDT